MPSEPLSVRLGYDTAAMLTADDFREIVLSLNGASEGAHMGHPDFRANGRVFASLHANEESGTMKLSPEEQAALVHEHPRAFAPAAGAWGRQGWTVVQLDAATEAPVRGALIMAWQSINSLPPGKSSARRKTVAHKAPTKKPARRA